MDDIKAKQQVVEKIKEASKILVTVSKDPSVDALSAALGLTLLFDKQEKYASAIFSGEVPPAIAFLEPEKIFDETTDSLRDFIIALNKEKADHLRYKVEGDSVKIFITPYKTNISKDDLEFSQGDYNVELVIALGVDSQDNLDQALEDHGQILHDATVITVSAGDQSSKLGGIDWHDANASSLSEMIAGLAEALKEDKKKPLIDGPIATALLTGIVAETDRFSNERTTSKAMTVAAQLMTAGADQQLIATQLEATPVVKEEAPVEEPSQEPTEQSVQESTENEDKNEVAEDGSLGNITIAKNELIVEHDDETLAELDERIRDKPQEANDETQQSIYSPASEPFVEPTKPELTVPSPEIEESPIEPRPKAVEAPRSEDVSNVYALDEEDAAPSLGGTLNATSEQAAEDARREAIGGQNKTILSHAYIGGQASQISSPMGETPVGFPGTPQVAPGSVGINTADDDGVHSAYSIGSNTDQSDTSASNSAPTFGTVGERVIAPLPAEPATPTVEPVIPTMEPTASTDFGLPLPPPLPDFTQGSLVPPVFPPLNSPTLPPVSPFNVSPETVAQTEILGDILAPEPAGAYSFEETPAPAPSNDPGQFKIPS